jgi:hypothetical protein
MGGLNTEERSACDVFDIVFDGNLSDTEDNGIEDEIIQKLVARVGRRVSKKYIRPIFKEPGSKISQNTDQTKNDYQQYGTIPSKLRKRKSGKRLNIVNPVFYRSQNNPSTIAKDEEEVIQPSLYHRLEYIVGEPIERHEFNNGNTPITLRTRLVHIMSILNSHADTDSGSSVASVSDLDSLEANTLRRKKHGTDLNLLRQEIKKIVSSSLDRREPEVSKKSPLSKDEERQGYEGCTSEGCTSHGCVFLEDGVGPFISDMKELWAG